jgi:lysophospholipase L1-like esterase
MGKNKVYDSFYLCVILIASLLFLYSVPEFSLGDFNYRRIDLLSDLKVFQEEVKLQAVQDSIQVKQDSVVKLVVERCRPGLTCIEDYSGDSTALRHFIKALKETDETGKPLRIAFYGDSFIEGDVFCGSFRDTLQSLFGGRGVGYVPITSSVTGFRNTIKHSFSKWYTTSLVARRDSSIQIGPSGYCFIPLESNWVSYKGSKQRFLRDFNTVKFYYTNFGEAAVQYTVDNDTSLNIDELKKTRALQEWKFKAKNAKSLKLEFYPHDSLQLYGMVFEDKEGIYVDNFSLRGNSGISLAGINDKLLSSFYKYRDYKLVILQFGLNGITEDSLNYRGYTRRMIKVVNKFKKAFPKSSFLLLSVGDRSSNKNGRPETMNAVPAMRNAQREIAQKTKIAFWDMYEAMGGQNSMVKFAQSRPPLAAKDYTHLTFKGGKKLATSLVKSLLFEAEKYDNRKKKR